MWMLLSLDRSGSNTSVPMLFFPGLMYGALFEVMALLPFVLWLRHRGKLSRGRVLTGGVVLWLVTALLQLLATSELPVSQSVFLLPALMVPGLALVLVFAFVMRYGPLPPSA
jgi:hypothetical protein